RCARCVCRARPARGVAAPPPGPADAYPGDQRRSGARRRSPGEMTSRVASHSVSRADLDKDPHDVAAMFDGVARRYDLTNTVLTAGQDRRWRARTRDALDPRPGERV